MGQVGGYAHFCDFDLRGIGQYRADPKCQQKQLGSLATRITPGLDALANQQHGPQGAAGNHRDHAGQLLLAKVIALAAKPLEQIHSDLAVKHLAQRGITHGKASEKRTPLRLLMHPADKGTHAIGQPLRRIFDIHEAQTDALMHLHAELTGHLLEQVLCALHVAVHRAASHTRLLRQITDGELGNPLLGEEAHGGLVDAALRWADVGQWKALLKHDLPKLNTCVLF